MLSTTTVVLAAVLGPAVVGVAERVGARAEGQAAVRGPVAGRAVVRRPAEAREQQPVVGLQRPGCLLRWQHQQDHNKSP